MATSQYSILRQYTPYINPYNLDLIKDVMMYKQGKVDVNREKINQQVDLLLGQQIAKPEAREYFENKMSGILNRINDMYYGADLSSDGVVRHIQGEISTVIDDTILNAIAGTKAGIQMQDYIRKVQLETPSQYSAMNAYVAMKPYMQWLNDGKAGSRLTPLQYTPYTDYNKELRDNINAVMKSHKGTTYQVPVTDKDGNPTGAIQEITRDMMTPEQVASFAIAQMSPNARTQMRIEAEYMADSNPDAFSVQAMRNYSAGVIREQNRYIGALEAEIAGAGNDTTKKAALTNELNNARRDLRTMQQSYNSITPETYSPIMGAQMLIENNFKNSAAKMYAYDNSSVKISKDPVYWAQQSHDMDVRNYNLRLQNMNMAQKRWEYEMGVEQRRWEKEMELKEKLGLGNLAVRQTTAAARAASAGLTGREASQAASLAMSSMGTGTVTFQPIDTENMDIDKILDERYEKTYTDFNQNSLILQNRIGASALNGILSYVDTASQDPTSGYQGLTRNEQVVKYFRENKGVANDYFNSLPANVRKEAVDAYIAASKAMDQMDVTNDRIEEENAVLNHVFTDRFQEVIDNGGDMGTALRRTIINIISKGVSMYPTLGGVNSDISFSSNNLKFIQQGLNALGKYLADNGYTQEAELLNNSTIYDYVVYDEETGGYKIDGRRNDGLMSVFEGRYDYYADSGQYIEDRGASVSSEDKARINEIRRKYVNLQSMPQVTYNTGVSQTSADWAPMNHLRNIYANRTGLNPSDITNITLTPVRNTNEFEISVVTKSGGDKYEPIIVSNLDLGSNDFALGVQSNNVDIGDYDSGYVHVGFADPTANWYSKRLSSNGINASYYSKESAINELAKSLLVYGQGFNDTKENPDPRRKILIEAADLILSNADKFRVRIEGYDDEGVGYNSYLYGAGDGKPEKIMAYDSPTAAYADRISEELALAPQAEFMRFVENAIAEELQLMIDGATEISETSSLGRILKFLKENG